MDVKTIASLNPSLNTQPSKIPVFDFQKRRAGLLLHPTSLPSGQLDQDVERLLNLMSNEGFSIWQVLPLCEPQAGLSPYQCSSTFAINPLLLTAIAPVDEMDESFIQFCNNQQFWLDDYALFKVLRKKFDHKAWYDWPEQYKHREPEAIEQAKFHQASEITILKWQQFQLYQRWQDIRLKASAKGIFLFGDVPIFVGHDSADVWAHQEWFLLEADGQPNVVTGVPPDYFSETGQRWGNPHYNWETMQGDDFVWWKARIHYHLEQFDILRIDHFRGMEAAWMIDAACETAVDGHWQEMPGDALLSSLQKLMVAGEVDNNRDADENHEKEDHKKQNSRLQLPFVAEDLGVITDKVIALRKKYHLPGMVILQFGFDGFDDNPHKLKNITEDKVAYTGTHDNDSTKGWFNSLDDHVKNEVLAALGVLDDNHHDCCEIENVDDIVVDKMIALAMSCQASICMISMQDFLHLGSESRMNVPGTTEGNWLWQFKWSQVEYQYRHQNDFLSLLAKNNRLVVDQKSKLID